MVVTGPVDNPESITSNFKFTGLSISTTSLGIIVLTHCLLPTLNAEKKKIERVAVSP